MAFYLDLSKIHKPNYLLRIIISSNDNTLYSLASFLHKIRNNSIHENITEACSYIKDSFELMEKLSDVRIENNYTLISLDVISLFINVPFNLAIESISNKWQNISKDCNVPKEKFIIALRFVFNSIFFLHLMGKYIDKHMIYPWNHHYLQ